MDALSNLHDNIKNVDILLDCHYHQIFEYFHWRFGPDKAEDDCKILSIDTRLRKVHCVYENVAFTVNI